MMPAARDISERLDGLRVPITIVAGSSDAFGDIKVRSKRLHETLPGSRLVAVPGAGHFHYEAQLQNTEAVPVKAAAVQWPP